MEVIIRPTTDAAVELTAQLICDQVKAKPDSVLGLATGRTMERLYDNIVVKHQAGKVSFARCASFNLDEYVGLAGDDENSYRYYMNELLFKKVDINIDETFLPDGAAQDLDLACKKYEEKSPTKVASTYSYSALAIRVISVLTSLSQLLCREHVKKLSRP